MSVVITFALTLARAATVHQGDIPPLGRRVLTTFGTTPRAKPLLAAGKGGFAVGYKTARSVGNVDFPSMAYCRFLMR